MTLGTSVSLHKDGVPGMAEHQLPSPISGLLVLHGAGVLGLKGLLFGQEDLRHLSRREEL